MILRGIVSKLRFNLTAVNDVTAATVMIEFGILSHACLSEEDSKAPLNEFFHNSLPCHPLHRSPLSLSEHLKVKGKVCASGHRASWGRLRACTEPRCLSGIVSVWKWPIVWLEE